MDILLIALLVSPFVLGGLFLQSMWGLLTVEIVPGNQPGIPIPRVGDLVEVYGTWVRDTGHLLGDNGWNEIHPTVYIEDLSSGLKGGAPDCKAPLDYTGPRTLRILDPADPCKWAVGTAQFVFLFDDGDLHMDLKLEAQYQYLAKIPPPIIGFSYPMFKTLVTIGIPGLGLSYLGASFARPRETLLGRGFLRLLRHLNPTR